MFERYIFIKQQNRINHKKSIFLNQKLAFQHSTNFHIKQELFSFSQIFGSKKFKLTFFDFIVYKMIFFYVKNLKILIFHTKFKGDIQARTGNLLLAKQTLYH